MQYNRLVYLHFNKSTYNGEKMCWNDIVYRFSLVSTWNEISFFCFNIKLSVNVNNDESHSFLRRDKRLLFGNHRITKKKKKKKKFCPRRWSTSNRHERTDQVDELEVFEMFLDNGETAPLVYRLKNIESFLFQWRRKKNEPEWIVKRFGFFG